MLPFLWLACLPNAPCRVFFQVYDLRMLLDDYLVRNQHPDYAFLTEGIRHYSTARSTAVVREPPARHVAQR